jgi:hypothetical protein
MRVLAGDTFSLTPALSRWEREESRPRVSKSAPSVLTNDCDVLNTAARGISFSLSRRERAGVRENG